MVLNWLGLTCPEPVLNLNPKPCRTASTKTLKTRARRQQSLGIGRLGSEGFWMGDYGEGGRVDRPFGARSFAP